MERRSVEVQCKNKAAFRYTWPGKDESYVCNECAGGLKMLSGVMGCYLQMIPLGVEDVQCQQKKGEVTEVD